MRIRTWQQRCEEHPDHDGIVSEGMIQARMQEEIDELRAAIEQPKPNARALHKMILAMIKEHWRSIDSQWKDDPELCHALGYEAGYKDAVARRVEPPAAESGAWFESMPASPPTTTWWDDPVTKMQREWRGLTDEERGQVINANFGTGLWQMAKEIEAKLRERNT